MYHSNYFKYLYKGKYEGKYFFNYLNKNRVIEMHFFNTLEALHDKDKYCYLISSELNKKSDIYVQRAWKVPF